MKVFINHRAYIGIRNHKRFSFLINQNILSKSISCFLCILLWSCEKSEVESNSQKVIKQALICTEKPLISKSDKVFVGIRYFKNYSEKDNLTLTLNGVKGIEKGFRTTEIEGSNYYFEFSPVMISGDSELILTIQNDQNTFVQKKKLKIIDNYNLENVWNNSENAYILSSFPFMYYHDIDFGVNVNYLLNGQPVYDKIINIGIYVQNGNIANIPAYKGFLPGLNGIYQLIFNDNRILTQIKITHGSPTNTPGVTYEGVVHGITQVYGAPKSVDTDMFSGLKITKFQSGSFNIFVYESKSINPIYTTITR